MSLPSPGSQQTYVSISPIVAGSITLPEKLFIHPVNPDARRTVPSLAFLITHPGTATPSVAPSIITAQSSPFRLLFDLGLRRHPSRYLVAQQKHLESRAPYQVEPGVAAQLQAGGVDPGTVGAVIISHVHYDHHGDPEDFPHARFFVGHGAMAVLAKGLGGIASHQHFDKELFTAVRAEELPSPSNGMWKPLGPLPKSLDLFGDGSVFVVDTPGHLPGHVNLLCRTGDDRWVALCGDTYHDPRLLSGEKQIATWDNEQGRQICIHLDKEAAEESIQRLRELKGLGNVELIAAHDNVWLEENRARLFPIVS